jgi:hypothetical protein
LEEFVAPAAGLACAFVLAVSDVEFWFVDDAFSV